MPYKLPIRYGNWLGLGFAIYCLSGFIVTATLSGVFPWEFVFIHTKIPLLFVGIITFTGGILATMFAVTLRDKYVRSKFGAFLRLLYDNREKFLKILYSAGSIAGILAALRAFGILVYFRNR